MNINLGMINLTVVILEACFEVIFYEFMINVCTITYEMKITIVSNVVKIEYLI